MNAIKDKAMLLWLRVQILWTQAQRIYCAIALHWYILCIMWNTGASYEEIVDKLDLP